MNPDNFTQPPAPQQPITPPAPQPQQPQPETDYQPQPQPQVTPEVQSQPVSAPDFEPTSTSPTFAAEQPVVFPATTAPAVVAAPVVNSHKALAIWTLITNLIYYCLPILVVLIFAAIYVFRMSSASSGEEFFSLMIVYIVLFFGLGAIVLLSGVAALILDIVYLVQAKPQGAKKVFTIISLCLFGLTFVGTMLQGVLFASFS